MAILWEHSLQPWIDINGNPYSGAKAYFYDAGTTTPKVVYKDAALSNPHDFPVGADSGGQFPAIFITEQTTYRIRITTATNVTFWDVDGISAPTTVPPDPPSGDTPAEKLFNTGDIKIAWRTSAPTGFVRLNGRTIGSAASAATERANDDCQALFQFLWDQDPNLAVSGGRGGSSAGDWAAAKTIALPDLRGITPVGLSGMGNAKNTTALPDDLVTGGNGDVLGAKLGEAKHALTVAEMPAHSHTGSSGLAGGHAHNFSYFAVGDVGDVGGGGAYSRVFTRVGTTDTAPPHAHSIPSEGGNDGHNTFQPSVIVPWFIKL